MQTKLQELTDKIYQEGVQKAHDEADAILKKAKAQAAEIIEKAQVDAQKIMDASERKATENARNIASEVKHSSLQSLSALKQTIAQLITLKIVDPGVTAVFSEPKFLIDLLLKIVGSFSQKGEYDLKVLLSEKDLQQLDEVIRSSFAQELNQGLEIKADAKVKGGFKIGPKDGRYLISFTEEDFKNFFKTYVRTKSSELLFDN